MYFAHEGVYLSLLKPGTQQKYHEVVTDKEHYVIAAPGRPFTVSFTASPAWWRRSAAVLFELHLDGVSPGYSQVLTQQQPGALMEGFCDLIKGQQRLLQFTFADAQKQSGSGNRADAAADSVLGTVTGTFSECFDAGPQAVRYQPATYAGSTKTGLREGKKWFLQPSINTKAGEALPGQIHYSTTKWQRGRRLAQVTLRLEMASVLKLRKVLEPSNPQHRIIIDESLAAMAASVNDDSAAAPRPAGARVKTERDGASIANPNITNLTLVGATVKAEPGGAQSGSANSNDFCDLTGGDGKAVWSSKAAKRARVNMDTVQY